MLSVTVTAPAVAMLVAFMMGAGIVALVAVVTVFMTAMATIILVAILVTSRLLLVVSRARVPNTISSMARWGVRVVAVKTTAWPFTAIRTVLSALRSAVLAVFVSAILSSGLTFPIMISPIMGKLAILTKFTRSFRKVIAELLPSSSIAFTLAPISSFSVCPVLVVSVASVSVESILICPISFALISVISFPFVSVEILVVSVAFSPAFSVLADGSTVFISGVSGSPGLSAVASHIRLVVVQISFFSSRP
mmetsp:Transcript_50726/g.99384  ORF Transcript_50726/g.99384 Transcript_50726/m.99384 type:complete len:250 (+) Transcript_50726:195-944(+)